MGNQQQGAETCQSSLMTQKGFLSFRADTRLTNMLDAVGTSVNVLEK
jgi:hypothetical protein